VVAPRDPVRHVAGLRAADIRVPIIALCDQATRSLRADVVRAGAAACYLTSTDGEALREAVASIVRRARRASRMGAHLHVDRAALTISDAASSVRLTRIEFALFEALARRLGRPASIDALQNQVWGTSLCAKSASQI